MNPQFSERNATSKFEIHYLRIKENIQINVSRNNKTNLEKK